jgi:F0F1-type ATP synthase assembly protein I
MPWWVLALRLSGLGFYIATCIVGGIVAGVVLDRALDTKVIFLLVGLIVGSAAAFYGTYRMVAPFLDMNGPGGDTDGPAEPGTGGEGR